MKRRQSKKPHLPTVKSYNWGSLYEGTKEQLIAAGLMDRKTTPSINKSKEYWLPLHWTEIAHTGYGTGKLPPRWDAESTTIDGKVFNVSVEFDVTTDMDIQSRADAAMRALSEALVLVRAIVPIPVHHQLRKAYGVNAKEVDPGPTYPGRADK